MPSVGFGIESGEDLEKLGNAGTIASRYETYGDQVALTQSALERGVQLLGVDLPLLEIEGHQVLVHLDHLIDECTVRLFHRGEIGIARRVEEAVHHFGAAFRRQVDGQTLLAERFLQVREQSRQVHVLGIDLVHDEEPTEIALRRPLHHPARRHLDAILGIHHDRCGIHGRQRSNRVAKEIRVAGSVHHVHMRITMGEVRESRVERVQALLFQRIEVADGISSLDGPRVLNLARLCEERFRQGGLAGAAVADEGDRANGLGAELWHVFCSPPVGVSRV